MRARTDPELLPRTSQRLLILEQRGDLQLSRGICREYEYDYDY